MHIYYPGNLTSFMGGCTLNKKERGVFMSDITYEIAQKVAVLSNRGKGWTKEINLVKWNDGAVKVDLREWNEDHSSMKKGITLNGAEFDVLKDAIKKIDENLLKTEMVS